jgi:DNA modification methylase
MKLPINQIICGDSLEVLKTIPEESIDVILTDPPYNVNYKYNDYKDNLSDTDYFDW